MKIFDLLDEWKSKQIYITSKSDAEREFEKQQKAIVAISNTIGYEEIKNYWKRVVSNCNERLRTMKSDKEMFRIQWELDQAMSFLDFLDNLTNGDLVEDQDIL